MKLLRFGPAGQEKPGILDADNNIRDLSSVVTDIDAAHLSDDTFKKIKQVDLSTLPLIKGEVRFGPCVKPTEKFICIGLNYKDHVAETGAQTPEEPVVFNKFNNSVCGPNDPIIIPRHSQQTDWEVELGVIIGKKGKYIEKEAALDYVAGYCVINDLSEREFQLHRSGQWVKGKSGDNFGPIGPYLVTRDEVSDPQNLHLWLEVDGRRFQDSNTKMMIFDVAYLVHYLSRFFTLLPGDIISTGTPPGVGLGVKPNPIYLRPGQTVRLGIDGLGQQQQITQAEVS